MVLQECVTTAELCRWTTSTSGRFKTYHREYRRFLPSRSWDSKVSASHSRAISESFSDEQEDS